MIEDVVCNKLLGPEAGTWVCRYHGRTLVFCSLACKERFELEPEDYLVAPPRPRPVPPVALAMR